MADTQVIPVGTQAAPSSWVLDNTSLVTVGALFAHFDGSGAAGSFVPTLDIISDSNHVVLSVPQDVTLAAGASAEASWAPFLKSAAAAAAAAASPTGRVNSAVPYGNTAVGANVITWSTTSVSDASVLFIDGTDATKMRINQLGMWQIVTNVILVTQPTALTTGTVVFGTGFRNNTLATTFAVLEDRHDVPGGATSEKVTELFCITYVNVTQASQLPYYFKITISTGEVFAVSSVVSMISRVGDRV